MSTGFVLAEKMVDDNGNEYLQRRSEAWETEELALQWAEYVGIHGCVVVPTDAPRLLPMID